MPRFPKLYKSLVGQLLGVSDRGNLVSAAGGAQKNVTSPCCHVTGTISAEAATVANQRDITLQLRDANGDAIDYSETVEIVLFTSSAMTDFVATGGSTGIAIGASGKLLAVVAKKLFRAISTTAGVIALTWTDTGTEAAYLGVRLPSGVVIGIGTLTNS